MVEQAAPLLMLASNFSRANNNGRLHYLLSHPKILPETADNELPDLLSKIDFSAAECVSGNDA